MSQLPFGPQVLPQPPAHSAASGDLALAYINSLTSRIERTEDDFVNHIKKIENRLDQLIDLMKAVATLQQQIATHSDVLTELRSSQRDQSARLEQNLVRAHERVDEAIDSISGKVANTTSKFEEKVAALDKNVAESERSLQKWLNRGFGAWAVSVLVLGSVQFFGSRWLDRIDQDRAETQAAIASLKIETSEMKHTLQMLLEDRHEKNSVKKD
jgi:DNA repair exonuclease SbcCD ATPase subunit